MMAALGTLALLAAAGCGKQSASEALITKPVAVDQAVQGIEAAFNTPGAVVAPEIKQRADAARQALANNQLEDAYGNLLALKSASAALTLQQDTAVRNALLGLTERTLRAAAAGDPKAIELARHMQGR